MAGAVVHPGSALGEAIGKLIEESLAGAVREVAEPLGYSVASVSLRNHWGSKHQVDTVVMDADRNPVILIEPKYLRYKKHNWDKGSRLCTAHYRLRRTFPSIRKSIGVLGGEWTDASIEFLRGFGVETHRISFQHICDVLQPYGITYRWAEKDSQAPAEAWQQYCRLSERQRAELASALTCPVRAAVSQSVGATLRSDSRAPRRVEAVELSIRTSAGEHLFRSFDSVPQAIEHLLAFVKDIEDVRRMLR